MIHRCYVPVTVNKNRRDAAIAIVGCVVILAALALIWGARLTVDHPVYVSELGAEGMPTRYWFMAALLCIVVAGVCIAWAGRNVRAEIRVLSLWTPAISLWVASGLFLVASQVTCTSGCPVPYGPSFDWQDLTHIVCAVIAFAFACWAMLQCAFARHHRALAILSGICCWTVAVIAGAGGIMSLARFHVEIGAWCEFAATTIAILWTGIFGASIAAERLRRPSGTVDPGQRGAATPDQHRATAPDQHGATAPDQRGDAVEPSIRSWG